MVYKFPHNLIYQVEGEVKSLCVDEGFIFVESKKKLYPFFEKASLPQHYLDAQKAQLEAVKTAKCEELNLRCDECLTSFESAALGEVYVYDSTLEDQLNLLGLVSANVDGFFRCRKKDEDIKHNLPHTKEQLKHVYADGLTFKTSMIYRCGVLKAKVQECQSVEQIQEITWDTPLQE